MGRPQEGGISRDMQAAYDRGNAAYRLGINKTGAESERLERLKMSWLAGWFAAYWKDIGEPC